MPTSMESRSAAMNLYDAVNTALETIYGQAHKENNTRWGSRFVTLAEKLQGSWVAVVSTGGILDPAAYAIGPMGESDVQQAIDYAEDCSRDAEFSACVSEDAKTLLRLMLAGAAKSMNGEDRIWDDSQLATMILKSTIADKLPHHCIVPNPGQTIRAAAMTYGSTSHEETALPSAEDLLVDMGGLNLHEPGPVQDADRMDMS